MEAQVYEGFFKNGVFHTGGRTISIPEERKTYITILTEAIVKPDTWALVDRLASEINDEEKLRFEDFPRFDLGRDVIKFDEV